MSDHESGNPSDETRPAGSVPPPVPAEHAPFAPPGTPVDEPMHAGPGMPSAMSMPGYQPELPRRKPTAYLAVLIGLVAMTGAAVFAARSFGGGGSNGGGAKSPTAAVQAFFDALNNEDAIGVLETFLPSEREVLVDNVKNVTKELGRLGVLKDNINLSHIGGVDLSFQGLTFDVKPVASGVTTVNVTAGTSKYRADPGSVLGDFVRGLLPPSAAKPVQGTQNLSGEKINFTTIRENDRWFVSLWYSMAEEARVEAGLPVPNFGHGLQAKGAASPEQAVDQFLRSAIALDVRRIFELFPPDEARALHDYAPLFLDDLEAAIPAPGELFTARIRSLSLESSGHGAGAKLVSIKKISFALSIPDVGLSMDYDGKCLRMTGGPFGEGFPDKVCGKGIAPMSGLPGIKTPELGFVVVERGGRWYVSPTRTVFDAFIGILKALNKRDLEQFKQLFEGFTHQSTFGQNGQGIPG